MQYNDGYDCRQRYRVNGFGRRRFAVAGPSTWNSLPDSLRYPELSRNTFKRLLKTYILPGLLTIILQSIGNTNTNTA